jgi:hypothetical protein
MLMDENPYQSPMADLRPAVGVLSGKREDVRAVAVCQKGILVCILIQILAVVCQFALPAALHILVMVGSLGVGLVGTVFIFMLATRVYGTGAGVLLGILTFIPCIGLIVLLIVNGRATTILRQNGYRVGLLGASLSQFNTP